MTFEDKVFTFIAVLAVVYSVFVIYHILIPHLMQ